jgi:hypothetical protein
MPLRAKPFGAGYIPFDNGVRGFFTATRHDFYLWLTSLYRVDFPPIPQENGNRGISFHKKNERGAVA